MRGPGLGQPVEDRDVGPAQVVHVHVVAQAGAVGRGVVGAEELRGRAPAVRRLDGQRDEVGLRVVVLADRPVRRGAGGVEVAERGERELPGRASALSAFSMSSFVWP